MNTFEFKNYSSNIVHDWSDEFFFDDCDQASAISFLHKEDKMAMEEQEDQNFGFDWLVEEDKRHFNHDFDYLNEADHIFLRRDRSKSVHMKLDAFENLMDNSFAQKDVIEEFASVQVTKVISKPAKKAYPKAQSVKSIKARITKKTKIVAKVSTTNKKSPKSVAPKLTKMKSGESLSTLSTSKKSTHSQSTNESVYAGFKDIKELSDLISQNVENTFKFNEKGKMSSLPQIFNSKLFSKETSSQPQEAFNAFMDVSLLRDVCSNSKKQLGQVESLVGVMSQKKTESNFEAGSYMATLESTIRSINKLKSLI